MSFGVARVINIFLNILSIPILIKFLGVEGYGVLVLAYGISGTFLIMDTGLTSGVTRFTAKYLALKDNKNVNEVISTSANIYAIIGVINAAALAILLYFNNFFFDKLNLSEEYTGAFSTIVLVMIVFSFIKWPAKILEGTLLGMEMHAYRNYGKSVLSIVSVSSAIVLAMLDYGIVHIFVTQQILFIPLWFYWSKSINKKLKWSLKLFSINKKTLKEIYSFSIWTLLNKVSGIVVKQFDTIIIAAASGPLAITAYSIVQTLIINTLKLMEISTSAIMPVFVRMFYTKGKEELLAKTLASGRLLNGLNFVIVATIAILIVPFTNLWVGSEYAQYAILIRWILILIFIVKSVAILNQSLLATGIVKKYSLITITMAFVGLVLTYFLVVELGGPGAVLATYGTGSVTVILLYLFVYKAIGVNAGKYFAKTTLLPLGILVLFVLVLNSQWVSLEGVANWIHLLLAGLGITAALVSIVYYLVFNNTDKLQIKGLVNKLYK